MALSRHNLDLFPPADDPSHTEDGQGVAVPETGDVSTPAPSGPETPHALPLWLDVLGTASIRSDDGRPVPIPYGKPLALLTYLALHPEGVPRDELARLLWGSKSREKARHSLRQALSRLRQLAGEAVFDSMEPVRLRPGAVDTDLQAFRNAVTTGQVDLAIDLWRGEPLYGLGPMREAGWAAWVQEVRTAHFRILLAALEEIAASEGPAGSGDSEGLLARFRKAVDADPKRPEGWLLLARMQVEFGQRREARWTLADAESRLGEDAFRQALGDLAEELAVVHPAPSDSVDPGTAPLTPWSPATEWAGALESGTRMVWCRAPDPAGTTRALRALAAPDVTPGAEVVYVHAEKGDRWSDLRQWTKLLGRLVGEDEVESERARVLARLFTDTTVTGSRATGSRGGPEPSDAAFADAFLELLVAVTQRTPVLLLLDAAHAVDAASWTVLQRIARLRPSLPLLVGIGTPSELESGRVSADLDAWSARGWLVDASTGPAEGDGGLRHRTVPAPETSSFLDSLRFPDPPALGVVSGDATVVEEPPIASERASEWSEDPPISAEAAPEASPEVAPEAAPEASGDAPIRESDASEAVPEAGIEPHAAPTLPALTPSLKAFYQRKLDGMPPLAADVVRLLGHSERASLHTLAYGIHTSAETLLPVLRALVDADFVRESEEGYGLANPRYVELLPKEGAAEPDSTLSAPSRAAIPSEELPMPEEWTPRHIVIRDVRREVFLVRLRTVTVAAVVMLALWWWLAR